MLIYIVVCGLAFSRGFEDGKFSVHFRNKKKNHIILPHNSLNRDGLLKKQ